MKSILILSPLGALALIFISSLAQATVVFDVLPAQSMRIGPTQVSCNIRNTGFLAGTLPSFYHQFMQVNFVVSKTGSQTYTSSYSGNVPALNQNQIYTVDFKIFNLPNLDGYKITCNGIVYYYTNPNGSGVRSTTYTSNTYTIPSTSPDTTPPIVSIVAPASGSTLSGTVAVSASASDNIGIAGVSFSLNGGQPSPEDTSAPYGLSWFTPNTPNGTYTLTAIARDTSGNTTVSAPLTVTVNNTPLMLACGAGPYFTVSPVAAADLRSIVPLGNLNPTSGHVFPTDHMYFVNAQPFMIPVVMPGDAVVTQVRKQSNLTDNITDYEVLFSPCQELTGHFRHVAVLDPVFAAEVGAIEEACETSVHGGKTFQLCKKTVTLTKRAGDRLGAIGSSTSFDFGLSDSRVPLPFINPAHYHFETLNAVCPLDFFTAETKSSLMALVGSFDGVRRTTAPVCGEVEQDEPGTAQGNWFALGAMGSGPEDFHLSLVHDNINPSKPAFSIGVALSQPSITAVGRLSPGAFTFTPSASGLINRDFKDVTAGATYCYQFLTALNGAPASANTILLVQMTDSNSLKIEKQTAAACGTGPWAVTSNAVSFTR